MGPFSSKAAKAERANEKAENDWYRRHLRQISAEGKAADAKKAAAKRGKK